MLFKDKGAEIEMDRLDSNIDDLQEKIKDYQKAIRMLCLAKDVDEDKFIEMMEMFGVEIDPYQEE